MKKLIEKITPAIVDSCKLQIDLSDGHHLIVHPHIVIRKKKGGEILKTMLDSGDCLDIPLTKISGVSMIKEGFAIDSNCLNFDHHEYELVFPKKEDFARFFD